MKRVFKFKEFQRWDGDKAIIRAIEDYLLEYEYTTGEQIKADSRITLIMERIKPHKKTERRGEE